MNRKLVAVIKTLNEKNGMKYHNRLLEWEARFEEMGVDIVILTNDSQECLDEIKRLYHSNIIYKNGANVKVFEDSIRPCNVFGSVYEQARPYLWLFDDDTLIGHTKQMNDKSLEKMISLARRIICQAHILKFLEKI